MNHFNDLKRKSGFDLAMGTSLAFESIFEPDLPVYDSNRVIEEKLDMRKIDEAWFNVATILRNLISSFPEETFNSMSRDNVSSLLLCELNVINNLFLTKTKGCKPVFYICNYDKITSPKTGLKADFIKPRVIKSPKSLRLASKMKETLEDILSLYNDIKVFNPEIKKYLHKTRAIIFTHYVYDLLSYPKFSELILLESNTGKIKRRTDWWSKYYPVPEATLNNLPFIEPFLMIFGDRHMFSPASLKYRRPIIELSRAANWNPLTTLQKVIYDCSHKLVDDNIIRFLNTFK